MKTIAWGLGALCTLVAMLTTGGYLWNRFVVESETTGLVYDLFVGFAVAYFGSLGISIGALIVIGLGLMIESVFNDVREQSEADS